MITQNRINMHVYESSRLKNYESLVIPERIRTRVNELCC